MYPFQPQRAWLEGSVLAVEYDLEIRRCDLVTASKLAFGTSTTIGSSGSFGVLHAYQEPDSEPVRLVVQGPDWVLLSAAQLRLLAEIVDSRPGEDEKEIVRHLGELADYEDLRTQPADWSFRTNPDGWNRQAD
jgi:hypothetical protein